MDHINWLAVVVAAASAFGLGGLWYGPLFKTTWCREAGIDPGLAPKHPARVFAIAFACSLLAAAAFAWFLGAAPELHRSLHAGFMIGLAWVAMSFGINYAFAQRSFTLWLIDAGYHVLQFTLYGLVIGLWH
jgi:hypothetical protein